MADEEWRDSPIAWFAVLERARQTDDFELAAEAQQQLKRLGVFVTYPKQLKHCVILVALRFYAAVQQRIKGVVEG
jgi:hypothetical protein